jgi:hypothetical protein
MKNAVLTEVGELIVTASPTSHANDFDFLLGNHIVHHKKLKSRLTGSFGWIKFSGTHSMEPLLNGLGNMERQDMVTVDGKSVKGIALRLFNPVTRLWSIYWADSESATLDTPVMGSFENGVGYFYAKDSFNGKPVLLQFKWDATNADQPVWSQAFSIDGGKSWEWNWYMYFSKESPANSFLSPNQRIGVIELRNYLMKEGTRDSFIGYFENKLIQPQSNLKGYTLGGYRVKSEENHFCWIRGFENMKSRSCFLPAFYYGDEWKKHRSTANSMLANNDNVYLLRPLKVEGNELVSTDINATQLISDGGITVIDFYIANTKLNVLKKLFVEEYLPLFDSCSINNFNLWTSEEEENDFPQLPVFQDKNLLVQISFFKNELAYSEALKKLASITSEKLKAELLDAVTIHNSWILYPTENSVAQKIKMHQ